MTRAFYVCLCLSLAWGCATPGERADRVAAGLAFDRLLLAGEPYSHVAYFKPGDAGAPLHVYLEHDGIPWIGNERIAADPTPRNLVMLPAMAQDTAPSLYLGRPCYFGLYAAPGCEPRLWTHERYSEAVVASMAAALREFLARRGDPRARFFGYSGGGVLAMLLAERFPDTEAVVTVAANLDVAAWARLHDYSALAGSLDPALRPPLPARVAQRHYAGARDRNVPPGLLQGFAQRPGSHLVVVPEFDHVCCWEKWWPSALRGLAAARSTP